MYVTISNVVPGWRVPGFDSRYIWEINFCKLIVARAFWVVFRNEFRCSGIYSWFTGLPSFRPGKLCGRLALILYYVYLLLFCQFPKSVNFGITSMSLYYGECDTCIDYGYCIVSSPKSHQFQFNTKDKARQWQAIRETKIPIHVSVIPQLFYNSRSNKIIAIPKELVFNLEGPSMNFANVTIIFNSHAFTHLPINLPSMYHVRWVKLKDVKDLKWVCQISP